MAIYHDNLRLWIIPFCMGIVWIGSFLVSFFYNYEGNSPITHIVLRLINAFNLILLFDILLMFWDIRLSLKNYDLHEDHSFKAQ